MKICQALLFLTLIGVILASPTNCNDRVQALEVSDTLTLGDEELVEDYANVLGENCHDALVCQIPCTCAPKGYSLFKLDELNPAQAQLYNDVCTTNAFDDSFWKSATTNTAGNLHLIRPWLADDSIGQRAISLGLKEPIASILKKRIRAFLDRIENNFFTIWKNCCKPDYKDAGKLRTIFFLSAIKYFNTYSRMKELCTQKGLDPKVALEQALHESVKGTIFDLTKYKSKLPVQELKDILLDVYEKNKTNYCSCSDMIKFAKSQAKDTSMFESTIKSVCPCDTMKF